MSETNAAYQQLKSRIKQLEEGSENQVKSQNEIDKSVQVGMKELNDKISVGSNEKLDVMRSQYETIFRQNTVLQQKVKEHKSLMEKALKDSYEKDFKLRKTLDANAKLTSVCQELQKYNKKLRETQKLQEELVSRRADEEEKRNELLHQTAELARRTFEELEVKSKMNTDLQTKFKGYLEEQQVKTELTIKQIQTKELEVQLLEKKLEQQTQIAQKEQERAKLFEAELESAQNTLKSNTAQTEKLHGQMNSMMSSVKKDMTGLTKQVNESEKSRTKYMADAGMWKTIAADSERQITSLKEEIKSLKEECKKKDSAIAQLESLCRSLHSRITVMTSEEGEKEEGRRRREINYSP